MARASYTVHWNWVLLWVERKVESGELCLVLPPFFVSVIICVNMESDPLVIYMKWNRMMSMEETDKKDAELSF